MRTEKDNYEFTVWLLETTRSYSLCVSPPLDFNISFNHTQSLCSADMLGSWKKSVHVWTLVHCFFNEAMSSQANYSLCFHMLIMVRKTMHTLSERMQKILWRRAKVGRTSYRYPHTPPLVPCTTVTGLYAAGKHNTKSGWTPEWQLPEQDWQSSSSWTHMFLSWNI